MTNRIWGFQFGRSTIKSRVMGIKLTTVIKIGVTAVGLVIVAVNVPLDEIAGELTTIRWRWAAAAFGLILLSLVLRSYRWQLLLRGLGISTPFRRLVELYFVGNFFNAFLPSGFGGDVVRVLEAAQNVPAGVAAGTVIVDRLTGLLMLFLMSLAVLPFRPADFPQDIFWLVTAVSLLGALGGWLLLDGRLLRRLGRRLPGKLSVTDESKPLAQLLTAVQGCGRRALAGALAVSFLFNLMLAGWWAASSLALGIPLSFSYTLLVVPILSVILLVPSISGLGVRENIAPILFAPAGLGGPEAVSLSLLVFILMRLTSLVGGPIYLVTAVRRKQGPASGSGI